jgi:hypothetical protein
LRAFEVVRLSRSVDRLDASAVTDLGVVPEHGPYVPDSLAPAVPLVADVDGDGCPDLVASQYVVRCGDGGDDRVRPGPAWALTRPIALVAGSSRLLVASSLAWWDSGHGPQVPMPHVDSTARGGWRSYPSGPFALTELPVEDLLSFTDVPAPLATVEPATGSDPPEANVSTRAGDRILARWHAITESQRPSPWDTTLERLSRGLTSGEAAMLGRSPVGVGGLSGVDAASIRLPLTSSSDEADATRWSVEVVAVNDWGEPATFNATTVVLDRLGPPLELEAPRLTAPWPFATVLEGRTEPGATVTLPGGQVATADASGRFTLSTQLAPWPQDVEIGASDAVGNVTVTSVSLMGGIDVRRLPWQVFLVALLSAALALAMLRGRRTARRAPGTPSARMPTQRGGGGAEAAFDEEPVPTIEDLGPADRARPR